MPREPSDARAALMTVYMSQRSSFFTLSDTPKGGKKVNAAERPPPYRIHAKKSTTTKMLVKSLKRPPHRRRSDADECIHAVRTSLSGPGLDLGRIGRTIYGVGESSRGNRRNAPALKRSQGYLTAQQVAVIEMGMEIARLEAERRHVVAKKGLGEMGTYRLTRVEGVEEEVEDMGHAERYFEMYINAEACG